MIEDTTTTDQSVHNISSALAKAFQNAGAELYLVGGAVRDQILGRHDFDLDFATSARPAEIVGILEGLGSRSIFRVGEKFGTIGAQYGDQRIEITTYRSGESYAEDSRKPEVVFGSSLLDDLRRRDFTINAIARDPLSGELIDPFDGRSDMLRRLLRAVGDPDTRFREDPLRLLRAVRFANGLGLSIEPETWAAMTRNATRLPSISRERVRDEYTRILIAPSATTGLTLLRDSGLLGRSAKTLLELTRMPDHGRKHPLSLWDHVMRVVAAVPAELVIRWAAVLHDIAKPSTLQVTPDGRTRFFHHEVVGAEIARRTLRDLRYPNGIVSDVVTLVETHMQLHAYSAEWSDGAVRRLLVRLGSLWPQAISLARADAAGHSAMGASANAPKFDRLEERVAALGDQPVESFQSPLSGDQLMERYGRPPGRWIQRIKDSLREEMLDGRLDPNDLDSVWRLADRLAASQQEPW